MDLIHLVGQCIIQNPQAETVSNCQLIQIRKQLRRWQTPVTGNRTVRAFAAHRKGGSLNMTNSNLQCVGVRTMVNRQLAVDIRNFNISDDPVSGYVQQPEVFLPLLPGHIIAIRFPNQCSVVGTGLLPELVKGFVVNLRHLLHVGGNGPGLVKRVPIIAYGGVQQ